MTSAPPTAPADRPGRRISRKEAIGLAVHRGLDRWLSPLGVWVMRRTRGGVTRAWKVDALVLTTRGRRSGRERSVVLQFFHDGEAMLLAAANDGGAALPGWYWNLTAEPAARVEVGGATVAVHAEVLETGAAERAWAHIVERDPSYERYARAAGRPIPIIRLTPADVPVATSPAGGAPSG
jgi:deazaflavin-dependent oxidoreductase (nitroreductase family)